MRTAEFYITHFQVNALLRAQANVAGGKSLSISFYNVSKGRISRTLKRVSAYASLHMINL